MRPLKIGKFKEKYYTIGKTVKESDRERRDLALKIAKNHIDKKPIKYLLKR
ncbi:hypothetical protein [Chryseobacterium sp.]|uniref:hypothetical protein n=1 Tax=Chryseobacterium sp. TaxID=1871047 RepID=UPI00388D4328